MYTSIDETSCITYNEYMIGTVLCCSETVIDIDRTSKTIGFLYLKVQVYLIRYEYINTTERWYLNYYLLHVGFRNFLRSMGKIFVDDVL